MQHVHVHGFSTAANILKDIGKSLTIIDTSVLGETYAGEAWEIVNTNISGTDLADQNEATILDALGIDPSAALTKVILKSKTNLGRKWMKEKIAVTEQTPVSTTVCEIKLSGTNKFFYSLTLDNIRTYGGIRIYVIDKKISLYLKKSEGDPDPLEFKIKDDGTVLVHKSLMGKSIIISYEIKDITTKSYYVQLELPTTNNPYNYLSWKISESAPVAGELTGVVSPTAKLYWYNLPKSGEAALHDWLPIEYWVTFDKSSAVGVLMGDPGYIPGTVGSDERFVSSPFYFGMVDQIEGALETDSRGNFGGFSGSITAPVDVNTYGENTANGMTDMTMVSTKSGRPFNSHKFNMFTGHEFREETFNSQSAHTGKHAVSDIVISDVHENDRGILRHCLAVPTVGKDHGMELVYKRYIFGEEQTYVFLKINADYTPINTSGNVLIGIAILT
jgi:hypothetical protein